MIMWFLAWKEASSMEYKLPAPGMDASQQPTPEHEPSVATAGCSLRHDEEHLTTVLSASGRLTRKSNPHPMTTKLFQTEDTVKMVL
jgi:hypothetical protein